MAINKKKIIVYVGIFITILAIFLPIISFYGNTYALKDGFILYPALIILLSVISLLLMTLKKEKFMLISTVISGVFAFIGIHSIFGLDALSNIEYKRESAVVIFLIGYTITIIGEIFLIFDINISNFKKKRKEEKALEKALDNLGEETKSSKKLQQKATAKRLFNDTKSMKIPIGALRLEDVPSSNDTEVTQNIENNETFETDIIEDEDLDRVNDNLLFDIEVKNDKYNYTIDSFSNLGFSETAMNNSLNAEFTNFKDFSSYNGISLREDEDVEILDELDEDVILEDIPSDNFTDDNVENWSFNKKIINNNLMDNSLNFNNNNYYQLKKEDTPQ